MTEQTISPASEALAHLRDILSTLWTELQAADGDRETIFLLPWFAERAAEGAGEAAQTVATAVRERIDAYLAQSGGHDTIAFVASAEAYIGDLQRAARRRCA